MTENEEMNLRRILLKIIEQHTLRGIQVENEEKITIFKLGGVHNLVDNFVDLYGKTNK